MRIPVSGPLISPRSRRFAPGRSGHARCSQPRLATLTHASNYLSTSIVGFIFMAADGISLTSVRKEAPAVALAKKAARETRQGTLPLEHLESRVVTL